MNMGYIFDTIIENHKIPEEDIWLFITYHYLDTLSLNERITIVKYLYSFNNGELELSEDKVFKYYFDDKIFNIRGNQCVILVTDLLVESSEERIKILVQDKNHLLIWNEAQPTDRELAIREAIKKYLIQKQFLNRFVGFMQVFKSNNVVFKTIDRENKLKKGSRCGGEGKKDVIKKINAK